MIWIALFLVTWLLSMAMTLHFLQQASRADRNARAAFDREHGINRLERHANGDS